MTTVLQAICPIFLWIFVLIHIAFIFTFTKNYLKSKNINQLLCACISFGLFFDAFIIAIGVFAKEGAVLQGFSQFRFISHGILIPLLFAVTRFHFKMNRVFSYILLTITGVFMIAGLAEGIATVLEVKEIAGIVRYAASKTLTPSWAKSISSLLSYGAVLPLIVGGIVDMFKKRGCFFFLSGFLMFVFSALGPATGNIDYIFFISMFGEAFMMLFLLLSLRKEVK